MRKLLTVDFRRVRKDKLFLVICIIAGVFALITPLLNVAIFSVIGEDPEEMGEALEMAGMGINGKSMFFSSFSLGNNLGLALPVLLSIILCKDFSQGTVRNKIIGGYSRRSIFFSLYTVCFTVLFGVMVLHATLSMAVGLIFFPYQSAPIEASDVGYFLLSLLLDAILFSFVAALVSFLCAATKNVGLAIVGYVGIVMGMSIITAVLEVGALILTLDMGAENSTLAKVLDFLRDINLFNYGAVIGAGRSYTTRQLLCCILTPLAGTVGLCAWGAHSFHRRDLK